jgi:hypothetical protein
VLAVAIVGLVVLSSASSSETNGAGETSTATTAQSPDGAIAHWALEEGTGTAAMDSVNGLVATLSPGATWASGRFGSGVALDGASGYVGAPIIDISGSALTLAAWVKIDSYPGRTEQRIISKATGSSQQAHYWMLGQAKNRGKNRLQFQMKTGNTTTRLVATTGELPTGAWFHAAATYDGAYVRLFLDGEEVGRTPKSGLITTDASAPVDIGRSPDGSNYLRGTIDEVRIYARALGAGEIASIMDGPGESPNEPPAVQLTSPVAGATFTAPATIALTATASDPENRFSDVQFFSGTTLLATDASAPYEFTWLSVPAGLYSLTAVARDADGGVATTAVVTITVSALVPDPWQVAFTASADHDSLVTSYLLEIFAAGADPNTATPVANSNLGKPVPDVNGEIFIDRTTFFEALAMGSYVATVRAVGEGGNSRSEPIAFSR